jgi:hypothetical protein
LGQAGQFPHELRTKNISLSQISKATATEKFCWLVTISINGPGEVGDAPDKPVEGAVNESRQNIFSAIKTSNHLIETNAIEHSITLPSCS